MMELPCCIMCPLQQPRVESLCCFIMPNPSNKERDLHNQRTLSFFTLLQNVNVFFESILDKESESHAAKKLKELCKTRWVEWHTCYKTFYSLYPIFGFL